MKPNWFVQVGFAVLSILFTGTAAQGKQHCSNAILDGSYGLVGNGTVIGVGPVSLVGVLNYDGRGNLTGTVYQKVNGNNSQFTLYGTYTVDATCTVTDVTHTSSGATAMHVYVVVDNGKEFYSLNLVPGNVISAVGKKQFSDD